MELKMLQLLGEIDLYKEDMKAYNEIFLPKYKAFRNECLQVITEEEFATLWNACNRLLKRL